MPGPRVEVEGRIKRYFADKGFGFIAPNGGGPDVFFHISNLVSGDEEDISAGARVRYRTEEGPEGPVAKDVSLLD
ncbi:MAG: cold shock domain-containing protein [Candidatus Brocadiia bacterium]|nr:cold shock domain-containing protein [Candidatus Brocadiia bacterium]